MAHREQLKARDDAQWRTGCDIRQELGHRLDVYNGGRAGTQQHLGALQPRISELGVTPFRLQRDDGLDPIGEISRGKKFARHVRVIEMAMGIDEPWKKNAVA